MRSEGVAGVREAAALLEAGVRLPEPIVRIPWFGPWLQERLAALGADRAAWGRELSELTVQWGGRAMRLVGDLGLNALRFGFALLTAYFLFRDGDRLLGDRVQDEFAAVALQPFDGACT